jgi:hypothetical protein
MKYFADITHHQLPVRQAAGFTYARRGAADLSSHIAQHLIHTLPVRGTKAGAGQ